eukprot:1142859-Pelagomonas_calceolata.AAC.3
MPHPCLHPPPLPHCCPFHCSPTERAVIFLHQPQFIATGYCTGCCMASVGDSFMHSDKSACMPCEANADAAGGDEGRRIQGIGGGMLLTTLPLYVLKINYLNHTPPSSL